MPRKSDFAEGFWTIALALIIVAIVGLLIGSAPSIDEIVFRR